MDLVNALPVGTMGASGLLAVVILLILRGNLIPRNTYEERMKDKEDQVEYYRTAYESERARNDELTGMVGTLVDAGKTTEYVMESLHQASQKGELENGATLS